MALMRLMAPHRHRRSWRRPDHRRRRRERASVQRSAECTPIHAIGMAIVDCQVSRVARPQTTRHEL